MEVTCGVCCGVHYGVCCGMYYGGDLWSVL